MKPFLLRQSPRDLPVSAWSLIAANLVPLFGVLFGGWSTFQVMFVFWLENVVVGIYNVLKMATVRGPAAAKVGIIPFFIVHYGIFTLVHGVFVVVLFGGVAGGAFGGSAHVGSPTEILTRSGPGWLLSTLVIPFLALMISHGVSFVMNFLRGGEWERTSLPMLMAAPYARIVILHLTIIFGAFGVLLLGSNAFALTLLIGLKIAVDLTAHLKERARHGVGGGSLKETTV